MSKPSPSTTIRSVRKGDLIVEIEPSDYRRGAGAGGGGSRPRRKRSWSISQTRRICQRALIRQAEATIASDDSGPRALFTGSEAPARPAGDPDSPGLQQLLEQAEDNEKRTKAAAGAEQRAARPAESLARQPRCPGKAVGSTGACRAGTGEACAQQFGLHEDRVPCRRGWSASVRFAPVNSSMSAPRSSPWYRCRTFGSSPISRRPK